MRKLTAKRLEEMKDHELINCGVTVNHPEVGINMVDSNQGRELLWVAVRGNGFPDWTIYCAWKDLPGEDIQASKMFLGTNPVGETGAPTIDYVCNQGEKVRDRENVEKLIGKLDDDVWKMYRS